MVVQVYENETVEVANFLIDRLGSNSVTAELLQPDELVSGIVAQVAAEPDMATLLSSFIYSDAGVVQPLSWPADISAEAHTYKSTRLQALPQSSIQRCM